ncbi:ribosome silencing factor [Methylocucumis oryzae]|uniref:Ribosomal silencing factor RsfS n=1 Tax=Methylocucumis oryzae TaxID=1632867 RepID=A0A0F3ILZ0_9GAMM|nr:ribosome silencing factor [Methylocucumis oryzae]KJV07523.1 ribosome-associated protein IOJAP [Methylocucumis oryzae]
MQAEELVTLVQHVLDEHKGNYITILDVREKTSITDYMVIVTGTSTRHLKALCDYVTEKTKEQGLKPLGVEGDMNSDWVLLDLGDVIVHAMTAQARAFYQLEKLWSVDQPVASSFAIV